MMRTILVALLSVLAAGMALAIPSHLYYTGLINNKLAIQMDLEFAKSQVSGQYVYDSVGEEIDVKGTWTKAGVISLKEHVHMKESIRFSGPITGSFTGKVSADRRQISGQWRSADGKRALPFTLHAVAEYRTHTVSHRYLKQTNQYPYFLNLGPGWKGVNQQSYSVMRAAEKNFLDNAGGETDPKAPDGDLAQQEYTLHIKYYSLQLISLLAEDETQFCVDGRDSIENASYNFRPTATGAHELDLDDLFNAKTPYTDALYDALLVPLDIDSLDPRVGSAMDVYTCSATRISFIIEDDIPYALLKAYLNPAGPLATLAQHAPSRLQPLRDAATGLTAEAAMQLGHAKFLARYAAARGKAEDVQENEDDAYARLLHRANLRHAAPLSLAQHNQYLQVRRELERLGRACLDAQGDLSDAQSAVKTQQYAALREETLFAVITALQSPTPDPPTRAHALRTLTTAKAQVDDEDVQKVLTEITTGLPTWPDKVAGLIDRYVVQVTKGLDRTL